MPLAQQRRRPKTFSIVWKNRETFFHCVEKSVFFFHSGENPRAAPSRRGDILGFVKTV
jgi:hypothetical protein